jgi:MoaA/NifB/PqqE/SkfB family radical SAM enzyme
MLERIATRAATLYGRRKLDLRMLVSYLRDGRAIDLALSRAPMLFEAGSPSTIGIELTNVCQLRCQHCDAQHPEIRGRPGYMTDATFARLVDQLRALRVRNLRVIGGGEPTLHPRCAEYLYGLRGIAPFLSLTTNGQRLPEPVCRAALAVLDVLEISVAGDDAESFARSRGGGDLARVLANLARLRRLRDDTWSRTLIQIRVMVRPSEQRSTDRLLRFWGKHGDVVSTQLIQDYFDTDGDAYPAGKPEASRSVYPSCVLPFRMLGVAWNGEVPLCRGSAFQTGTSEGLVLGNINTSTLAELWNGPVIRQYRDGQRKRLEGLMPICRNCPDAQTPAWRKRYDNNRHLAAPPPSLVPVASLTARIARR